MDIVELKELERKATPGPWGNEWYYEEGDRSPFIEATAKLDAKLLATLRNLSPELIALWEAGNRFYNAPGYGVEGLHAALIALNEKAQPIVI
jgi:hypothetical protein